MSSWTYPTSTLWMHYFDVFNLLDGMRVNGNISDADCAIALSFGRNSVPDYSLSDIRNSFAMLKEDSVATIDHINRSGFNPGLPNIEIARKGLWDIVDKGIPLLAQWELCVSIYQQRIHFYGKQAIDSWMRHVALQKFFCLWPWPNRLAYRTIEVLEDAFKITQKKGWKRPILLAHDYHLPHVAMLARHFWPEFIIGFPTITRAFDKKSVQPMTTCSRRWYEYEFKARAHHFLYGYCFGYFQKGRF